MTRAPPAGEGVIASECVSVFSCVNCELDVWCLPIGASYICGTKSVLDEVIGVDLPETL